MSVISSLQNLFSFARIKQSENYNVDISQPPAVATQDRTDLLRARSRLLRIYEAIEILADQMNVQTRFRLDLPDAQSIPALTLDLTSTAATLASVDEINASPHSFSPFGPTWGLGSGALITIGGEYDGSNGSGGLSFEAVRGGTHGTNNLRIRVTDPLGGLLTQFNIQANDPLNQQYDLTNGLFLTLGPGDLIDNDTTSIQVFQNIGSAFDPNQPLGGIRNENPNFQYYPAPNTLDPITDGSFQLNGETILVSTTDTLNTIVDRINQSDAGVTANYNPATERIELIHDTLGSGTTIDIQNDTSNFIAATKLDAAVVQSGIDPENEISFNGVAEFSGIQSGNILINGTSIAIDPSSDSLMSAIDKINASAADVTATFDTQTQKVTIEANNPESVLDIDSNGTGFFAALNIPDGRVDPEAVGRGISRRRSYAIADAFESVVAQLNDFFNDESFTGKDIGVLASRSKIVSAANGFFLGDSDTSENLFGVRFDRSTAGLSRGRFAGVDRREFTHELQIRGADVKNLFAGSDSEPGLIGRLLDATGNALADINRTLGFSGAFVDTYA